jgi:peptide-methionine (S)-S-oxide reductase
MRITLLLLLSVVSFTSVLFAFPWRHAAPVRAAPTPPGKYEQATFAAGCFWGVEEAFRHRPGVIATQVGYSGGHTANPTYREVCTHLTGHAESVLVTFDPEKISYAELLDAFWSCHDPTTLDAQGPDIGNQYRSVIFYHNPDQEKLARASLLEVDNAHFFPNKIVTEIVAAAAFYPAEDYHQQYFAKNGGTCHLGPATVHTRLAQESAESRRPASLSAPNRAPHEH